jgi:ribosomal protein L11 methylase PrmA
LEAQENYIKKIYKEWFDIDKVKKKDGWVCISGIRRNN